MHLPSARVYQEMRSEEASLWYVPANDGKELALLIKCPTSCIKALLAGCSLKLVYGKNGFHLCTGGRILDMPDAPIFLSRVQREAEEHSVLVRALNDRKFPAFLFNELDACVAWTNVELATEDASKALQLIGDETQLYVGSFESETSHSLDCFCFSVDDTNTYPNAKTIPTVEISVSLEPWRTNHISYVGLRGYQTITLNDKDEGEMLERAVWASLESVFPLTLYKSPQVRTGVKIRELTDVLSFHEYGNFLIEAKDLSVLQAGYERGQERRTKSTQKQVKKAIKQLVGASKALKRGESVIDTNGSELQIDRTKSDHCIILITELMHCGDWSEIEDLLVKAMRATGAFSNLLDLREFIALLKGSSGKATLLDYNLMQRCKVFAENGSIHIRSQRAPNP